MLNLINVYPLTKLICWQAIAWTYFTTRIKRPFTFSFILLSPPPPPRPSSSSSSSSSTLYRFFSFFSSSLCCSSSLFPYSDSYGQAGVDKDSENLLMATCGVTVSISRAGIMEAADRQMTTVFTVQTSFHHRHSTNRVSWSGTIVGERRGEVWLHVRRRW